MSHQQKHSLESFGSIRILDLQTKKWVPIIPHKIGDLKHSIHNSDHSGWTKCDGRSLLRSEYPTLFSIVGTSFGSDSPITFNIPNTAGRVLASVGQADPTFRTWSNGDYNGTETHEMTLEEMPSHNHAGTTVISGDHSHTGTIGNNGIHTHTITDPGHTHTQTTVNDDFNNSGENPPGFTGDSAGTRTWNNINSSTTGISINADGEHNHNISISSDGSHSHNFTTGSVGGSASFNIMQPTLFIGNVFIFAKVM
jgi:microcystin-dependent protein